MSNKASSRTSRWYKRGWRDRAAVKCLPLLYDGLWWIPRTICEMGWYVLVVLGLERRHPDPGSMARQPSLMGEAQANEKCSFNGGKLGVVAEVGP